MRPFGLDQQHRVRRRSDFRRAYEQGQKIVRKTFVLFVLPNGVPESRVGITATRKTGNAVIRNRAKRLVREAYRHRRAELPAGHDYVVVVRHALLRMSVAALGDELVLAADSAGRQQ